MYALLQINQQNLASVINHTFTLAFISASEKDSPYFQFAPFVDETVSSDIASVFNSWFDTLAEY